MIDIDLNKEKVNLKNYKRLGLSIGYFVYSDVEYPISPTIYLAFGKRFNYRFNKKFMIYGPNILLTKLCENKNLSHYPDLRDNFRHNQ